MLAYILSEHTIARNKKYLRTDEKAPTKKSISILCSKNCSKLHVLLLFFLRNRFLNLASHLNASFTKLSSNKKQFCIFDVWFRRLKQETCKIVELVLLPSGDWLRILDLVEITLHF